MSDEDDYMSDKFLTGCVQDDIRPGLLKSHADKRNFLALKRKREQDEINRKKNPNIREMESEKRKEGLDKPIESGNKGFALLQKMGYKPGGCIGKTETGRTEPIPIELKSGREGLGRSQMKKDLYEKKLKNLRPNTVSASEFRLRIMEKKAQRQMEADLRKSQKICETLDQDNNISEPDENWFWLSTDPSNEEEKEKKLKKSVKHRRGECDNDSEDYSDCYDECDADTALDTEADSDTMLEKEVDSKSDSDQSVEAQLNTEEKLHSITAYLREQYFYCIWCSVRFNDEEDLRSACPGKTREDH